MTPISLSEISYPVFKLGAKDITIQDGVACYFHINEYEEHSVPVLKIIDDKNYPQPTLALRRLQMAISDVPLAKIGTAIFFLGDLIKISKPSMWFIDSLGKLFRYEKNTRAKLKFHRVSKLLHIQGGGVVVEAEGISSRFKSLYAPEGVKPYIGVLHFGKSLVLYGFYEEMYDETWRMV